MNFDATKLLTYLLLLSFTTSIQVNKFPTPTELKQQISPEFTRTSCMFDLPPTIMEGTDVECGYLSVPENRSDPASNSIQLAVVILKTKHPNPQPDPLILAQGGPGGSTIDTYAELLLTENNLLDNREIVLFDQRGTLYSKPSLACKEIDQLVLDTIEKDISTEEYEQLELVALEECRIRLAQLDIDLSAYNSLENAKDIEDLRVALNLPEINLYGVSYGTLLALHYLRLYPNNVRSIILDAVVPPQSHFILDVAKHTDRSLNLLFDTCSNDLDCNKTYPDLEKIFYNTVQRLEDDPAIIEMIDLETGITYEAVLDGESFVSGIFLMLYSASIIPALPKVIYETNQGSFDFIARILPFILFDRTTAYGMYFSVLCSEDADFNPEDQDLSNINPLIAKFEEQSPNAFLNSCKKWDVPPLADIVDHPITSSVPALILSGNFDPITPPEYGALVSETLPNSYEFTFMSGGHGQAFDSGCADRMIASFLNDPTKPPDSTCLGENDKVEFFSPKNTIDLRFIPNLLNLEDDTTLEFLVLLLALIGLSSSLIISPLAWIVQRIQRKPISGAEVDQSSLITSGASISRNIENQRSFDYPRAHTRDTSQSRTINSKDRNTIIIRAANWWATINSLSLWLFLILLFIVVLFMILENDNRLFYGLDAASRPLFLLPYMSVLLTLLMIFVFIEAWRKHSWSRWRLLYFSFLCLCAAGGLTIFYRWGIFFALFH